MNLTNKKEILSRPRQSFWQLDLPYRPLRPPLLENISAEFVIVGGGYAGLSTAYEILDQKPGAEVIIVERDCLGFGASGRSAGLMSPIAAPIWIVSADMHPDQLWGLKYLNHRSHEISDAFRSIIPESQCVKDTVHITAMGPVSTAVIERAERTLEHAGIDFMVKHGDADQHWPSAYLDSNSFHPFRLVREIATYVENKGVKIFEGTSVDTVSQSDNKARVVLDSGYEISAGTVVICTNAYSSYVSGLGHMDAKPIYTYLLTTEELDDETLAQFERPNGFVVQLNKAAVFYRFLDNRILFGAIEKSSNDNIGDFEVPNDVLADLSDLFRKSFPSKTPIAFADAWTGPYHLSANDMPIIQRVEGAPSILLNVGYGFSGIALSFICAPIAASMAIGSDFVSPDDKRLYETIRATRPPIMSKLLFAAGIGAALLRTSLFGHRF